MNIDQEWENYVYQKLHLQKIDNANFIDFTNNYKEIINELLSFIATFRQYKFLFNLDLENILYDSNTHRFTLINLKDAKFKLNKLSNDEYYFNFISLYFSICKKYHHNINLISYLKKQIVNYIPIKELHNFHFISNSTLIDLYV